MQKQCMHSQELLDTTIVEPDLYVNLQPVIDDAQSTQSVSRLWQGCVALAADVTWRF